MPTSLCVLEPSGLEEARAIVGRLEVRPASRFSQAVERLDRAQQAFAAGRPLLRGELGKDVPEGLRRWLEH